MNKNHYRILIACILVCILTFSLFWWNERQKASNTADQKDYRIEVLLKAYSRPPDFWQQVGQGIDAAEREFGVTCNITAPDSEGDVDVQIALLREAIAKKPNAIILAACDYDLLAPVCKEAADAGIRLLTVDSDVNFDGRACFVGTDNYEMGNKLAQLLKDEIGETAPFGVVSHVAGTSTSAQRLAGLMENTPNADTRMVELAYCDGYVNYAKQLALRMLREHPELKCLVALNESSALGSANAIEELGLADTVSLVVCDSSEKQLHYLESGTIKACVVQNPFSMGYLSVANAVKLLDRQGVEPVVFTDSIVVRKENMNIASVQQLIIPFVHRDPVPLVPYVSPPPAQRPS